MAKDNQLSKLIKACRRKDRKAQKELYQLYFAYAMTVCLHYAKDINEAKDILNEGFFKVFTKLHQYEERKSFKPWLRRILVNTAIDYHRKYYKMDTPLEIVHIQVPTVEVSGFDRLALDDILNMVQQLPRMYRTVFNLFVLEGYSHVEIAKKLGISIGGSKSNLSRAKSKLREMITIQEQSHHEDKLRRGGE